jgi:hypothetical protein
MWSGMSTSFLVKASSSAFDEALIAAMVAASSVRGAIGTDKHHEKGQSGKLAHGWLLRGFSIFRP